MHLRSFLICTALLLSVTLSANAQYRKSLQDFYLSKGIGAGRAWQRISLGIGKFYIPAEITLKYKGYNPVGNVYIDTTLKKNTRSRQAWVAHIGTFFPIDMLTDNSMIAVNVELVARSVSLAYDSLLFFGSSKFMSPTPAYMVGLPICFEYKRGGEVSLDKKDRSLFTVGAGIVPCIVNSDDYNAVTPYKFIPFIKAEIGFVAGIGFKLRGMAYFGKTKYSGSNFYGLNNIGANDELHTTTEGGNGYSLSLIIMPFSWSWDAGF
jgi:hypothetical protein